jgi:hypothetical protein
LQPGRWYVDLLNSGASSANGTLTATYAGTVPTGKITLDFSSAYHDPKDKTNDCDISYWADSTPATPIGGNSGTTLGQQRKNALAKATEELATQLQLPVTVTLQACGAHLGGDSNSAILAHAGANSFFFDSPSSPTPALPKKYTWYPSTVAARLNGSSLCGFAGGPCDTTSNDEIAATFNMDFGTPDVLGGETFYLGFDTSQKPPGAVDFITVAMHEITHGLGFLGLVNVDADQGPLGARAGLKFNRDAAGNITSASLSYGGTPDYGPYDDIFDSQVAIVDGSTYTPFTGYEVTGANDAARAAAMVSGPTVTQAGHYNPGNYTGIRWSDTAAASAAQNIHASEAAPDDFPSLYAPCDKTKTTDCAMQSGSTLSHTVQAGDMMNAYYSDDSLRDMGLAVSMLGPIGWSNSVAAMPAWGQPIPSAWYDRTHSGHGFDFQLDHHDAVNGDVYVLTFYTYSANGTPEWYETYGHIVDGVFLPDLQQNGITLYRIVYSSLAQGHLDPQVDPTLQGSVVVDFNQADKAPACRNADRGDVASLLAVMYWTIGNESGTWCMEPALTPEQHATPDYNGLWYAPSDSGWGFELLDVAGTPNPTVYILMYLPPASSGANPTWAQASGPLVNGSVSMPLQQVSNGYCRSCAPPASQTYTDNGTITLHLDPVRTGQAVTGKASFSITYPGGGSFSRSDIPIQMISIPTGQ